MDQRPISAICPPEELLKAILDRSSDAIILLDSEGRIREWSASAARLWGRRRDDVLGRDAGSILGASEEVVIEDLPGGSTTQEFQRSDGATFRGAVETHPLYAHRDVVTGTLLRVQDLSETDRAHQLIQDRERSLHETLKALRRSHESLKSTQLQLIQAAKLESIGRLAAGVAHEVKNPLAILLTGVQLLARRLASADAETREVLADLEVAVKRANHVIRGLLDFAAATELQLEAIDPGEIVKGAVALLQHEMRSRHVRLDQQLQAAVPALSLDRTKIEQIVVNLMINAMDAMPEGGVLTVRASVRALSQSGHGVGFRRTDLLRVGQTVVAIEIEDTGTGIAPETLARAFVPFFTTKAAGKGTGLGLAVCRSIAELHRGVVWLENKPDGGTRATLCLPAGESERRAA